jgi:glycosyltransferase involved in cell wall biosynthesis
VAAGTAPQRVLFAYREDVDVKGGAASVMHRTAEALEQRGVEYEITYELDPDPTGFDVVHAVNLWHPKTALEQLRNLRASGSTIVWQPFYLGYSEFAWAHRALPAVFDPSRSGEERTKLIEAFAAGAIEVHGMRRFARNEPLPGFRSAMREMVDLVDRIVVCSMHEAQLISQHVGFRGTPFTFTPHGVHAERFADASPEPFRDHAGLGDRPFALCVGAIDARKNQLMLAYALRDSELALVLVGPTFERGTYELVRAAGGDNLIHIDRVAPELVASAYHGAEVHALPSWAEGAALVNLEAASAGCPVVVSDRSSEFEYFGDLGVFCDPADPQSIRVAVESQVGAREREPDRIAALRARMAELPWDNTAATTIRAYELALRDRRAATRIQGARGFTTLAFADELIADPEILRAYGEAFGGDDDATLVIYAPRADLDRIEQQLIDLVAEAGMGEDGAADLLALPFPDTAPDERALAAGVDAILSAQPAPAPFDRHPRYSADRVAELRAAVD